jgi:hypothetical protein
MPSHGIFLLRLFLNEHHLTLHKEEVMVTIKSFVNLVVVLALRVVIHQK